MGDYWLVGARIIDGTGAEPYDGKAIHIENGRISAVATPPANARGTYVTVHAHNNAAIRAGAKCVEHGSEIDDQMAALMAAKGVAHVPTLAVVEALLSDAGASGLSPTIADRIGIAKQGQIDGLLASRAAGVKVGSGSDLIGFHQRDRGRELTLRSEIETPILALESATRVNAEILGIAGDVGTIEVGKVADLAAWRDDPMANPKLFADPDSVALVIQNGRVAKDAR